MEFGKTMREGFEEMVRMLGCTVQIYKNLGTRDQKVTEVRGLKNSEKNRPDKVIFQFLEALDIQNGDILQQKGTRDLWRVIDTEDERS
ncbi:MAG TPA: hypothetical protein VIW67_26270 [Terriglobales bacterium]